LLKNTQYQHVAKNIQVIPDIVLFSSNSALLSSFSRASVHSGFNQILP